MISSDFLPEDTSDLSNKRNQIKGSIFIITYIILIGLLASRDSLDSIPGYFRIGILVFGLYVLYFSIYKMIVRVRTVHNGGIEIKVKRNDILSRVLGYLLLLSDIVVSGWIIMAFFIKFFQEIFMITLFV